MFGIYWDTWDCCGLFVLIFRIHIVFIDLGDSLMEKNLHQGFLFTTEYCFYLYRFICIYTWAETRVWPL